MALDQKVLDALAANDAKIAALDKLVTDFIAAHQTNSAADTAALVTALQTEGSALDATAAKLAPPSA